jgi:hypothetical protein
MFNKTRLKNKILQIFYRPRISSKNISFFDELEKNIEEKITPLLEDFF